MNNTSHEGRIIGGNQPTPMDILNSSYLFRYFNQQYELEKIKILYEKVEFSLLMTLDNDKALQQWLPGKRSGDYWVASIGCKINTIDFLYNEASAIDKNEFHALFMPHIHERDMPHKYPLIGIYAIANNLISHNKYYPSIVACRQLARHFGIDESNIYEPVTIPDGSTWQESLINNVELEPRMPVGIIDHGKYSFLCRNGTIIYKLQLIDDWGSLLLLPMSTWIKKDLDQPVLVKMMPSCQHRLLNLNLIAQNNHASIFLTEHIEVAINNTRWENNDSVWTSWYGGYDTIKYVDWSVLEGRRVYYILLDTSLSQPLPSAKAIQVAMKLLKYFDSNPKIKFHIIELRKIAIGGFRYIPYTEESFIKLATKNRVRIPETLRDYDESYINVDKREKHEPKFVITPVIKEKTITVLFAPSGIGKSWLGLSIGLAVANGEPVFSKWKTPEPRGVMYILGEMEYNEIEDRLVDLNKRYKKTGTNNNFDARRINNRKDISTESGQRLVDKFIQKFNSRNDKKISLLILDNLSTLAEKANYQSGWDNLFKWLEEKKRTGMSIIVIHHANRGGKYLGTGSIMNKADFMIHACDKDEIEQKLRKLCRTKSERDKENFKKEQIKDCLKPVLSKSIVMYIHHVKLRSVAREDIKPFRIALNPNDENPEWRVTPAEYDNILMEHGYSLDEFAEMIEGDHLGEDFFEKYGIPLLEDGHNPEDSSKLFIKYPKDMPFEKWHVNLQRSKLLELWEKGVKTVKDQMKILKVNISERKFKQIRSKTRTTKQDIQKTKEHEMSTLCFDNENLDKSE